MPDVVNPGVIDGTSIKIREIATAETGGSSIDCWRLTAHTQTGDVNFEGYGDISWNLIEAALREVEGFSPEEVLDISAENKGAIYWTGFVVVNGYRDWVVIDTSSTNITSWRKIPGLGHKVEFLVDVAYKDENVGVVGSAVKYSR